MKKTQMQEWFLLKKNWMEDLKDLSNEDFGLLVRSLFTSGVPEGHLKMIYGLLKDEFDRVNEKREEGLAKRREGSKKAVEARRNNTSHTTSNAPVVTPEVNRTQTQTDTHTDTKTKTMGINNDLNSLKESEDYIGLSWAERAETVFSE